MNPEKANFLKKIEGIDNITSPQKQRAKQLADCFLTCCENSSENAFYFYNTFLEQIDLPYLDKLDPSFDDSLLNELLSLVSIFPLNTTLDGLATLYIDFSAIDLNEFNIHTTNQVLILNMLALCSKYNLHKKNENFYSVLIDCTNAGYKNCWNEFLENLYFILIDCFPANLSTIYIFGAGFITKPFFYYSKFKSDFKEDLGNLMIFASNEDEIIDRATDPNKLYENLGGRAKLNESWCEELKKLTKTILFGNAVSRSNLNISQTASKPKAVTFGSAVIVSEQPVSQPVTQPNINQISSEEFSKDFNKNFKPIVAEPKQEVQESFVPPADAIAPKEEDEGNYDMDTQLRENKPKRSNRTKSKIRSSIMNTSAIDLTSNRYLSPNGISATDWLSKFNEHMLRIEHNEILSETAPQEFECTISSKHHELYRHRAFPIIQDNTRVIVNGGDAEDGFYNASYIDGFYTPKKFICAESPTKQTIGTFMTMLWEQNVEYVVGLIDQNVLGKCEPYFPETLQETMNVGQFELTCTNLTSKNGILYFTIKFFSSDENLTKTFTIVTMQQSNLEMMKKRDNAGSSYINRVLMDEINTKYPILLHDSSGTRLPAVVIGINIIRDMMAIQGIDNINFDLKKVAIEMRRQRNGVLQMADDYLLFQFRVYASIGRALRVSKKN